LEFGWLELKFEPLELKFEPLQSGFVPIWHVSGELCSFEEAMMIHVGVLRKLVLCLSLAVTSGLAVAAGEAPQTSPAPPAAAAAPPAAAPLANLDFEQGEPGKEPPGWSAPFQEKGYSGVTSSERPEGGARCAVLTAPGKPGPRDFGNLMRWVDATPYRGKRVRFRAAVRMEGAGGQAESRAQLWLRVDRSAGKIGFFDNMQDRPVTAKDWGRYEIVGDVARDADQVYFGMILLGPGRAFLDSASFEVLSESGVGNEPARALTPRGLENLIALARLTGYVRYFHPSDQAAALDWNRFTLAAVQAVEKAAGPAELARTLTALFLPIAPTVRVFPTGRPGQPTPVAAEILAPPASPADAKPRIVAWRHLGLSLGVDNQRAPYQSRRTDSLTPDKTPDGKPLAVPLPEPGKPFRADLGGGVSTLVPLALYADAKGTLPAVPTGVVPQAPEKPEGFLPSGDDRATRLADGILAWNVFQHFYPYFDVARADWPAELRKALGSAATDPDAQAFERTLRRLVAALHDGHGRAGLSASSDGTRTLPLLWDWVEGRLVVTQVDPEHAAGLAPGDVIVEVDGRPAAAALADVEERISAATPQWRRWRALQALAIGDAGTVRLTVEHPGGRRETVAVQRSVPLFGPKAFAEKRPEKIAEVAPGIFYVDIGRINDDDWKGAVPRLAQAKGIVFDFRGYPSNLGPQFLQHLTAEPLHSAQWRVPVVTRPDREGWTWWVSSWNLQPLAPRFTAKVAFVTDGRAISYAESCMGIVEHYKLGAIVGGPTAGTNGNINPFTLPGGYHLVWTGMQVLKHDGSRHHGVGILPTVLVARTLAGVAAGKDELLEKAIAVVSN
jgi:C-terminal processing protease CtpA/Prc